MHEAKAACVSNLRILKASQPKLKPAGPTFLPKVLGELPPNPTPQPLHPYQRLEV